MELDGGSKAWQAMYRVLAPAITVPVIVGYVSLGIGVVVGRAVRDVVRAGLVRRRSAADGRAAGSVVHAA